MVRFSLLKVWTSSSEVLPQLKGEGRVTLFYCCFLSVPFNHTPYLEMKICSQLLLIFLILFSAKIGSVRQHGENDPYQFMRGRKNSLFE